MLYGVVFYDIMGIGGCHMKLNYDRKSKNPTYFIQQGIRNGKKTTTRNVKVIGKHNELLKITDDPLAYAKKEVERYNEEFTQNKVKLDVTIDFNKKLTSLDNNNVAVSKNTNIGYFFLQKIYSDLKLDDFFRDATANRKIKYDCNLISRFLTFSRILYPASKLSTYRHLHYFYEQPHYEYYDSMRFLSVLAENFDEYISHLYKNSNNIIKRDTSVCYYDCTNYYFEIEYPDDDYVDEVTGEVTPGFRKYGFSKQHQPNPLVQMGLFMDSQGIPLSMSLSHGSKSEQLTAAPTETAMLKTFKNKKIIYCADAGLGSYKIREFNSIGNRAFIATQSIKKLSDTLKTSVFNDFDYRLLSTNEMKSIEDMKSFDRFDKNNLPLYNDMIYKVVPANHLVDLGLEEVYYTKSGKKKTRKITGELKQSLIITFSRKTMEYQRKIRNKQIERAKALIKADNIEKLSKNQNDPKRFIKRSEKSKTTYIIDEEKIKEEEKYDGFYAIATNLDAEKEYKEIIHINSQRYQIENCFRILKTNFESRPAYESLKDHITGHFMTCYTALLVYKLLEARLNRNGQHFTIDEIIENLKNMNVVNCHDLYYQATYSSSRICDALNAEFQLDLDKEFYQPKELNKKIKKISK